ncbi:MAG: hypothetical protein ACRCTN_06515, partial [Carnobacterium maltaromaticum]
LSVINKNLIPQDTKIMQENEVSIKSACEKQLETIGKSEELKIEIGRHELRIEPIVSNNHPEEYVIVGVDAMEKEPELTVKFINDKIRKKVTSTMKI